MSTLAAKRPEAVEAPPASTSVALVPLMAERVQAGPAVRPAARPNTVHRWFFAMWYAALAIFVAARWIGAWDRDAMLGFFILGGMLLGLGGLGVLIYVVHTATAAKLRQGLGAVAAFGLVMAAMGPLGTVAREVNAAGAIPRLAPLAEEMVAHEKLWTLVRDPGARLLFFKQTSGFRAGYENPNHSMELTEAMRRAGMEAGELDRFGGLMRAAGLWSVQVQERVLVFRHRYDARSQLMYVRPGQVLPQNLWLQDFGAHWQSEPLGGGWYLIRGIAR